MERDRLLQRSTEHVGEQSTTPRSAKGSPREAVRPGYFQSPRGHQVHLPFHLALGGTNRNRWSNGMPFDVTRRVGNSQYDNQLCCAQIIPSCIIPVNRHPSRPCSSEGAGVV